MKALDTDRISPSSLDAGDSCLQAAFRSEYNHDIVGAEPELFRSSIGGRNTGSDPDLASAEAEVDGQGDPDRIPLIPTDICSDNLLAHQWRPPRVLRHRDRGHASVLADEPVGHRLRKDLQPVFGE